MENISFDRVLFKTAFAVMACDGEIHRNEISLFKNIAKTNPYFLNLDFENELKSVVDDIKSQGINYIENYLKVLQKFEIKEKQKLLLVEVILKIIEADKKIDDNELKFLNTVTSILNLNEQFLIMKFPKHLNYFLDMSKFGDNLEFKNGNTKIEGVEVIN